MSFTLRLVRLMEVMGQPSLALLLADSALAEAQANAHNLAQLYAVSGILFIKTINERIFFFLKI